MFGSLGFTELILILVIVLIIFGAGKLPQLGEGVGKPLKDLKNPFMKLRPMILTLKPRLKRERLLQPRPLRKSLSPFRLRL